MIRRIENYSEPWERADWKQFQKVLLCQVGKNWLINPETIASTIEPNNAEKKPPTTNPGVKYPTNPKAIALTTNRNKPKVKIVRGKVKTIKIGLTTALTNPNIAAPIIAALIPVIAKPGTTAAVTSKEIAVANQVSKNCSILCN